MAVRFVCGKKSLRRESRSCAHHIVCAGEGRDAARGEGDRIRRERVKRAEHTRAELRQTSSGQPPIFFSLPIVLDSAGKKFPSRYENVPPSRPFLACRPRLASVCTRAFATRGGNAHFAQGKTFVRRFFSRRHMLHDSCNARSE